MAESMDTLHVETGRETGLERLTREVEALTRESEKLADEVLRCYEQINFIFDVSAQIAVLEDADEVRRMLLVKLRHMFDAESIYYVTADRSMLKRVGPDERVSRAWAREPAKPSAAAGDAEGKLSFDAIELPPEFSTALRRLEEQRRVFVHVDEAGSESGHGTSMWGPLNDDEKGSAAVGLIRRHRPFVAGDMLLLDSALTYASHILSNLRLVEQLKRTSFEAVRALVNAIDQKDAYTAGHSERVGFLAKTTGQHMGLPARQVQDLEWAGLLHDIGKIGIPEEVLNKAGKLTSEEFALIKGHPSRSFEVLRPVASLAGLLDGVLYHHENPDGSGYPEGLKGDQIPLMARIIHVVDVFDALTSTRSYRKAFPVEEAMQMIWKDAGTKLDAAIVQEFMETWALLPKTHPEQYERWYVQTKESGA
ncbi:MAG: HD-GYP domain-containing protein [Phycisphaerae bacterium]